MVVDWRWVLYPKAASMKRALWSAGLMTAKRVAHPDAEPKIAYATAATKQNPIATALFRRARALQHGTTEEFESIAADLDSLGCQYQAARTLVLAGGAIAEGGVARLNSLGATGP
jgi:hypothetical protein